MTPPGRRRDGRWRCTDPGAFGVERDTAGPAALRTRGRRAGAASLSAPHSLLRRSRWTMPWPGGCCHALAAHLLAGEDSDLSLWFQRQYAPHLAELQAQTPGRWRPFPCHMAHLRRREHDMDFEKLLEEAAGKKLAGKKAAPVVLRPELGGFGGAGAGSGTAGPGGSHPAHSGGQAGPGSLNEIQTAQGSPPAPRARRCWPWTTSSGGPDRHCQYPGFRHGGAGPEASGSGPGPGPAAGAGPAGERL